MHKYQLANIILVTHNEICRFYIPKGILEFHFSKYRFNLDVYQDEIIA